jgi:hypothetical protein
MASNFPFPYLPPRSTDQLLSGFDEHVYFADPTTVLYKYVDAMVGTTGAGDLLNQLFMATLGTALETIYFNDLDFIFGNMNFLARSTAESYAANPHSALLTSDDWDQIRIADAWYRARVKDFFVACGLGGTPEGVRECIQSAIAVDCDLFEVWRYEDNFGLGVNLGRAPFSARNEIVIRPHKATLSPVEARLCRDMLNRLVPIETLVTVSLNGLAVAAPIPIANAASDSTYFEVQKVVTGTPLISQLPPPEFLPIDLLPTEQWLFPTKEERDLNISHSALAPYAAFNITQEYGYYYLVGGGKRSPIDSVTYGCADVDTEILTLRGWLCYNEVTTEDTCLTLNTDTGQSEWQPIRGVYVYPGRHKVIKMENLSHSSVTTHDHRWPVTSCEDVDWGWRTTETLTPKTRICAAAPVVAPIEPKWSDALVELVAWFWTEGHIRPHESVTLTQSQVANPENVARIRAAIVQTFGPEGPLYMRSRPSWREDINERGIVHFRLNKKAGVVLLSHAPNKIVSTEFLSQLTRAQLELFIQTSIDADGTRRGNGSVTLRQRDRARLDAFQIACALAGKAGTVVLDNEDMWRMCITKSPWRGPADKSKYMQWLTIDEPVWCVSTANQTWFARRNGTVYATGNTLRDDGTVKTESNYEVYSTSATYTDWKTYDKCDSPDNYPGGKFGKHPDYAPAIGPDSGAYDFPFPSQAAYVEDYMTQVLGMGGIADESHYKLPIQKPTQAKQVFWPSNAVAYFPPARASTISKSITRQRGRPLGEGRDPGIFVRS